MGEDTDYLDRLAPEHVVAVATGARTAHRYPLTVRELLVDQHRRGRAAADYLLAQGDRGARLAIPRRNLANVGLALARARAVPDPEERRVLLRATPLLLVGALACALGALTARGTTAAAGERPGRGAHDEPASGPASARSGLAD